MSASPNDRYQRVDAIFDAVLDLPDHEQTSYIDHACGDDAELREEVLQLLAAHRHTRGFLD